MEAAIGNTALECEQNTRTYTLNGGTRRKMRSELVLARHMKKKNATNKLNTGNGKEEDGVMEKRETKYSAKRAIITCFWP